MLSVFAITGLDVEAIGKSFVRLWLSLQPVLQCKLNSIPQSTSPALQDELQLPFVPQGVAANMCDASKASCLFCRPAQKMHLKNLVFLPVFRRCKAGL
jgi:hypothetical protein